MCATVSQSECNPVPVREELLVGGDDKGAARPWWAASSPQAKVAPVVGPECCLKGGD